MKKLPFLRWSLDICAVLLMLLRLDFAALDSIRWPHTLYYENPWHTIINLLFVVSIFVITMREAIFHPLCHKMAWTFFIIGELPIMLYIIGDRWDFFDLFLWVPCIIFFFIDRSKNADKKMSHIFKYDIYFYMILSSVTYTLIFCRHVLHGGDFSTLMSIFLFPFFVCSLLVWAHRGSEQ